MKEDDFIPNKFPLLKKKLTQIWIMQLVVQFKEHWIVKLEK